MFAIQQYNDSHDHNKKFSDKVWKIVKNNKKIKK